MGTPRMKYGGPIYGGPIIDTPDPALEINFGPFAAEIKILRKKLNLSLRSFGALVGADPIDIMSWEMGKTVPHDNTKAIIVALIEAFQAIPPTKQNIMVAKLRKAAFKKELK